MSDEHDNPPEPDDDLAVFLAAMAEVRPLRYDKVEPARRPPPPRARQQEREHEEVMGLLLSDPPPGADVETGEELWFTRPGLQQALLRKLRRGQLSIGAELDLHGLTVAEARAAVSDFLRDSLARGVRCVRIIHGKGHGSPNRQPVLKTHLNYWLPQREEILAFCSARPVDGGTGAVYVLLRRQ